MQNVTTLYYYLPQLQGSNVYEVRSKKIYADPSYLTPYNVLISFKSEAQNVIEGLGLKQAHSVDTSVLKATTWIEEYRLYFMMQSVNALRYNSIENEAKKIKWWKVVDCTNNYAAPYFDKDAIRGVVGFGQKNNGRIACCRRGNTYYILIECWG